MSFQRILVALDEEPVGAHAADIAVDLARALGAQTAFIVVIDPSTVTGFDGGVPPEAFLASEERDARRMLASFCQHLPPDCAPLLFVKIGTPAAEILKAAAEWPADLIVVGSHGRGGVARAVLGSVAETITRHAPCPVLVVRKKA